VRKAPTPNDAESRVRAEEWKKIGALAFLDDTARAVDAYERALSFAPNDPQILDQLAWLYDRLGKDAERDRVAARLASSSDPDSRARGLLHQADVHLEANDGPAARPYVMQALEVTRGTKMTKLEIKATTYLAAAMALSDEIGEARTTAERALAMARAATLRYEEAEAIYAQGSIAFLEASGSLFRRKGHLERAESSFVDAHRILVDIRDEIGAAHIQVRLGHLARVQNHHEQAEQHLRSAIAVFEKNGVRSRLGFAYHQLGVVLSMTRRMDDGRLLFRKGAQLAHSAGRLGYEAMALFDWAVAESKVNQPVAACNLARESEAVFNRAPGAEKQRVRAGELVRRFCR
jgi:tetratricopeptide (TPR) repeat protein